MNKQNYLLTLVSNNKIQKFCYFIALILWLYLSYQKCSFFDPYTQSYYGSLLSKSSLGVPYLVVIAFPAIILLFQTIYNKLFLWFVILCFYTAFNLYFLSTYFYDLINRTFGNHIKALVWNYEFMKDTLMYIGILILLILINYLLFKMKPSDIKNN